MPTVYLRINWFYIKKQHVWLRCEYFLLKGAAMVTVYGITYANLNMKYHEIKLYNIIVGKYIFGIKQHFIENWKRFIFPSEIC